MKMNIADSVKDYLVPRVSLDPEQKLLCLPAQTRASSPQSPHQSWEDQENPSDKHAAIRLVPPQKFWLFWPRHSLLSIWPNGCKRVPLISKGWKDTAPRTGRTHWEGFKQSTKDKGDKARIPWDEPWGSMPGSKLRPITQLKASTLMYIAWATKKRSQNPLHSKQNMY